MTPISRRFFTAFYEALRHLRPTTAVAKKPASQCCSNLRPLRSSTPLGIRTYFTSSVAPVAAASWGPRSRYVVSRGFAGFCAWTTVPSTSTTAPSASSVVVETTNAACKVFDRARIYGAIRRLHTDRRGLGRSARKTQVKRSSTSSSGRQRRPWPRDEKRGDRERYGNSERREQIGLNGRRKEPPVVEQPAMLRKPTPKEYRYLDRISNIHRPTKDEMLAAASNFWQRLRIRTKWTLIRQMRPYNWEDISAFFSWLILGHMIWIAVGTTTFFGVVVVLLNSVIAQETVAGAIGNYLTKETGVQVVFESAIVPKWRDNKISFHNVFVSRRPGHHASRNVQKGSPETAAAAAAAAVTADHQAGENATEEEEDTNYTQFDVTIETVNVTLSFARWMNGKGLLKDVELKGIRGVIDRTHVFWEDDVDPRSYKHKHQPGDFEIESFRIEDLLVTVHQPDNFRPFSVSIFSCELPQLRKQWLFYDFLSATNCSGSYDDSLFTIHPRQYRYISDKSSETNTQYKKTSRLRIDGLNIDHLNRGITGPFSWITSGTVDIIADVLFPPDPDDFHVSKLVQDIYEQISPSTSSTSTSSSSLITPPPPTTSESDLPDSRPPFTPLLNRLIPLLERHIPPQLRTLLDPTFPAPLSSMALWEPARPIPDQVVLDLSVALNDVRAAVPIFTSDLSYVNNALIRPIVAYINSRRTMIPIRCRVVKKVVEFEGSWTLFDSGLMDDMSAETYEAFARNVTDQQAQRRRLRKVGLWSLQLLAQVLLMAMAGTVA